MHDEIKKFTIQGIVGDEADVVENRGELVRFQESVMRDEGYAPVLDMDSQYTQQYNVEKNHFEFVLSVYGVYVGMEEACKVAGVMHGKTIFQYIPKVRLQESSTVAE